MTPDELMLMRRQKGLTQAEFGASLIPPVSRLTVSNWERGRFAIPHDLVVRMAQTISTNKPTKQDKTALETYRSMRHDVCPWPHAAIIEAWAEHGFVPSPTARAMIAAEFPDILNLTPNPEK